MRTILTGLFVALVLASCGGGRGRRSYLRIHEASVKAEPGWVTVVGGGGGSHAPDPTFTIKDVVNKRVQIIDELVIAPRSIKANMQRRGVDGRTQLMVIFIDNQPAYYVPIQPP